VAHGFGNPGKSIEASPQTVELSRRGEGETDPCREAFEIGQVLESRAKILEQLGSVRQLCHRSVTFADFLEVDAWTYQPVAE
jgi:hypothetical protein